MPELTLVIGTRNYSSWSLRPWLLLRHLGLEFSERLVHLGTRQFATEVPQLSPSGRVPVLLHGATRVWESLAICEYACELAAGRGWPGDARVRVGSRAFLRFLDLGGEVEFEDLTAGVLRHHLRRGLPVLTGLSATYLYRSVRERLTAEGRLIEDDLGGSPQGHFVVLCGYHTGERTVTVADPMFDNPMTPKHRYTVPIERLVNSILIGILTHDANLLVIQPRHTGKGPDAHPLRRRQS